MPEFETPTPHRPNRATLWPLSVYYLDVSELPAKADSAATIAATAAYHEDFGGAWIRFDPFGQNNWDAGGAAGTFLDALPDAMDPETSRENWTFSNDLASTPNPHLYFADLRQQGATKVLGEYAIAISGDRHFSLISEDSNELVEGIGYNGVDHVTATVVTFDISSYDLPLGTTGTQPAGSIIARIPWTPFAFTYQDLLDCGTDGELGHMVSCSLIDYQAAMQWPARKFDGEQVDGPVCGDVFRLSAGFDLGLLANDPLKAFARTLQTRGGMLTDRQGEDGNGAKFVTGVDPEWPNGFNTDDVLAFTEFDIVDLASVAGAENSIQLAEAPVADIQVVKRKVAGVWVEQVVKRKVAGVWVEQTIRRITP